MKKVYIFLTHSIDNVAGAQLYISRKMEYLASNGWVVDCYYHYQNEIMINNFVQYAGNYIPELHLKLSWVSEKRKKQIVNRIIKYSTSELVVIESHTISTAVWGEYFAEKLSAKHICYLLSEIFPTLSISMKSFFLYKKEQHLLFGICDKSIPILLKGYSDLENLGLAAVGSISCNVEDIYDERVENIRKADYNILSIGRLEKAYVPDMIQSIIEFANEFAQSVVNVYIIGSSRKKEVVDNVLCSLHEIPNIQCFYFGYTYPIPRSIFVKSDVCIASSGSVRVAFEEGVTAIAVDANDHQGIGVYGYTTKETLFRNANEPPVKIADLLKQVLVYKKYSNEAVIHTRKGTIDYSEHQKIIDRPYGHTYYPVEEMGNVRDKFISLLGVKGLKMLVKTYKFMMRFPVLSHRS